MSIGSRLVKWFSLPIGVSSALAIATMGCGGDPTGESAYSQKFEKPADAKATAGAADTPNPFDERRKDKEADPYAESAPKGRAGGRR